MDSDTWSRSMVAMLGLGTVDDLLQKEVKSTPMVPPQHLCYGALRRNEPARRSSTSSV
jgi:hypothetical protein